MTYALQMFKQFFFFTYPGFLYKTAENLKLAENYLPRQLFTQLNMGDGMQNLIYVATFLILLIVSGFVMTRKNTQEIIEETRFDTRTVIGLAIIFIWSFVSLSNVSTFIYFQF
jgi:alginate O-acetyltransferase complex protein AlgI